MALSEVLPFHPSITIETMSNEEKPNPPAALSLGAFMSSPSYEMKMEFLTSLSPGTLAAFVAHGFFSQGINLPFVSLPASAPAPPSFNLGRAIAEFRGPLFTGAFDEVLNHWLCNMKEVFKLWKVPRAEQVGFVSAFLKGLAKDWFY